MNSIVSPGLIDLTREPDFRLGAIEIRPAAREVIANGERDVLEPRVMQVLVALARRRDAVVSRDELITLCWAGRVVGDDAINRCIGRIRRLSETYGGFSLETVPRIGYRLTESVADRPSVREEIEPSSWLVRHRLALVASIAAFLLLAGGLTCWLLWPAAPARFTIAVLPFTPPPGDREAEQLGDAISVSIADMLVSEGFDVVSPAKTRAFHGAAKADAAQALHATFVVDGEIRRIGGRTTVPVRIVNGTSGTTLIADTIESADSAALPEAVATRVLACGWGWLLNLNASSSKDLPVMDGVLKAVKHLDQPTETVYAYDYGKQIVASRPNSAFAQLFHAVTAAAIVANRHPDARLPVVLESRAAAEKTIELVPDAADAYAVLAEMTPVFNWTVREGYLKKGLRLRPTAALVYMDLLALRMNGGYLRVGGRMAEDAYSNHPHFDNTIFEVINGRLWLGNLEGARALARHAMPLFPNLPWFSAKLFEATAFYGALDDAEALLHDPAAAPLLQMEGEGATYSAIVTALRHGRPADVRTVVDDCVKTSGRSLEFRRICFMAVVKLGRLDDAYRMAEMLYPDQRGANPSEIERRWLSGYPLNTAYLVMPLTAPLRADPRYRDLVERIGLLQFWKERGIPPDFCAAEKVPLCAELKR